MGRKAQLPIRFTAAELKEAKRAARIETERTGHTVTMTEVLRLGGLAHVRDILAAKSEQAA